MKLHFLDVVVFVLALIGVVIVTILEHSSESNSSHRSNNSGVSCFPPAHFQPEQSDYVNRYCKEAWKVGKVYDPFASKVPKRSDGEIRHRNAQPDWKPPEDHTGESNDRSSTLNTLLLSEAIAAILIFILLRMVVTTLATRGQWYKSSATTTPDVADEDKFFRQEEKSDRQKKVLSQMSQSRGLTIVYGAILLGAIIIWVVLAAKSHGVSTGMTDDPVREKCSQNCTTDGQAADEQEKDENNKSPDVFMCDFRLRVLGNVQRYTVQCVADSTQPQTETQKNMFPAQINTAVCFTIAGLLLLHLFYTLVVAPLVNNLFMNNGKQKFFSDVHLFTTLQIQ